ncbi:MAG: hypothetical protein WAL14_04205, partial [Pseudolabrys sp.]
FSSVYQHAEVTRLKIFVERLIEISGRHVRFWDKADMRYCTCPLSGAKRTLFGKKRTSSWR